MNQEDTKPEKTYSINEDHVATIKDLRIMGLELRMELDSKINSINSKINGIIVKLGTLIIGCSSIFVRSFISFSEMTEVTCDKMITNKYNIGDVVYYEECGSVFLTTVNKVELINDEYGRRIKYNSSHQEKDLFQSKDALIDYYVSSWNKQRFEEDTVGWP